MNSRSQGLGLTGSRLNGPTILRSDEVQCNTDITNSLILQPQKDISQISREPYQGVMFSKDLSS